MPLPTAHALRLAIALGSFGCQPQFDPFVGEWIGRYDIEVDRSEFVWFDVEGTITAESGEGGAQLRVVGSSFAGSTEEALSCDGSVLGAELGLVCTQGGADLLFSMYLEGRSLDGSAADPALSEADDAADGDILSRAAVAREPGRGHGDSRWRTRLDGDRRVAQAEAELVSDVQVACAELMTVSLSAGDEVQTIEADIVREGAIVETVPVEPQGSGVWSGESPSGCADSEVVLFVTAADGHAEWVTLELD